MCLCLARLRGLMLWSEVPKTDDHHRIGDISLSQSGGLVRGPPRRLVPESTFVPSMLMIHMVC